MVPTLSVFPDRLSGDPWLGGDVTPDRVAAVLLARWPPEVVLHDGRVGFVAAPARADLRRFAGLHYLPEDDRVDVWSLLLEPFLDTAFDAPDAARNAAALAAVGLLPDEVEAIRSLVGGPMLGLTALTWEWVHYGLFDLLAVTPGLLPGALVGVAGAYGPDHATPSAIRRWAERIAQRAPARPPTPPEPAVVELRRRFVAPGPGPAARAFVAELIDALIAAWTQPHRGYHGASHLLDVLGRVDGDAMLLAAWFHDAVYDPTRTDNEARSAAWLDEVADDLVTHTSVDAGAVAMARRMVLATAAPLDAHDAEVQRFLDADFGVFGEPPEVYDRYVAGVRGEYVDVPDALFDAARAAFLNRLAAAVERRGWFFREGTPLAEHLARANLTRERARLRRAS